MGAVDKLNWGVRLGFGAGDLAQNLVLATVGTYLLFFCTDVVGLAPSAVATMFLVVQLADALWNLFAGVLVDRHHPPWGKYRSYLLLAGIPFALFAVLCFAHPLGGAGGAWKTLYAYAAYAGFTLFFTLVNVAYSALGASLTRFECDAFEAGEKVAHYALAVLAKGRVPSPPVVYPQYVFGATFPY